MPALFNLSHEEIHQLEEERYTYGDIRIQKRLNAVYLMAVTDLNDTLIAKIVNCHRNSIPIWRDKYLYEGSSSLYENHYRQPESVLEQHSEVILSYLDMHPMQSVNQVASVIEDLTGIKRKPTQVREFLLRHGYKWRKTGQIPGKAKPEEQKDWLETKLEPVIEQAREGKCHLLFCDAAHFVLSAFPCMVWSRCRLFLQTAAGRNRINVLGAVNAISRQVTTYINTTYITSQTIVDFLIQIKSQYVDLPVVLVMDNAKYQHCKLVTDKAKSLSIELLFLPAYSPNLNIIERLWKFTKKKILYARYYDTPAKFHQAITDFFLNLNQKYQTELESLLTLKFQLWEKKQELGLNGDAQNLAA
jgi:transposase